MRRRYIALQPGSREWKYAVAVNDQGQTSLIEAGTFERSSSESLASQLAEVVGRLQVTDRLAWVLPAQKSLFRWLEFPFNDTRKIAATVRTEMLQQLPFMQAEDVIYHQRQQDGRVLSVAVNRDCIEGLLEAFDDNLEPLGYLGIAPLGYISGLDWSEDSLFICSEDDEIVLGRCESGWLTDLRILERSDKGDDTALTQQLLLLARSRSVPLLRLTVLGNSLSSELEKGLNEAGFSIDKIRLQVADGPLADECMNTGCLALAAARAGDRGLNLRSGVYALKNDWQIFKRKLWLAVGLLFTIAVALGGSGYLKYQKSAQIHEHLKQEMVRLYQQEFPGEKLVVTPSLQLQSKIKEMRKKAAQFGSGTPEALPLLLAVSERMSPELSVDIREYLQNNEGVRLIGNTANFDSVSKLLVSLQTESLFQDVKIVDTKQSIDGSRVDFQMQIRFKQEGAME